MKIYTLVLARLMFIKRTIYVMYAYVVIVFDKAGLKIVSVFNITVNAILVEIRGFKKTNFGSANVIYKWIKVPFP